MATAVPPGPGSSTSAAPSVSRSSAPSLSSPLPAPGPSTSGPASAPPSSSPVPGSGSAPLSEGSPSLNADIQSLPTQSSQDSGTNVYNAANPNGDHGSADNNLKVVVPIAIVACALVIIYVLYRIYLLRKRSKQQSVPLPPPRTPAIFEARRPQSVLYSQPEMMGINSQKLAYRQSAPPTSFMYDPGTSTSSLFKGIHNGSVSGHSTPTGPLPVNDTLPPERRSFRAGSTRPRPHSIASLGSTRGSLYVPPLRNSPHLSGGIILPQPLAPGVYSHQPTMGRQDRYSMFNAPTQGEMAAAELGIRPHTRQASYSDARSSMAGRSASPRPLSLVSGAPQLPMPTLSSEDWTGRLSMAVDRIEKESTSTCTTHPDRDRSSSPPPPALEKPKDHVPTSPTSLSARTITSERLPGSWQHAVGSSNRKELSSGIGTIQRAETTTPSSFSAHGPIAFPVSPSLRARSATPPESLLTGAFISGTASSESK